MHICWMQVVGMVGMMLRVVVIFLVVVCYKLHSALRLPKKGKEKQENL